MFRVRGAALALNRVTIVRGVVRESGFPDRTHLDEGAYVAMDPAFDNQHHPADQDSRTSFPDKDDFGAFAPPCNGATARTAAVHPHGSLSGISPRRY
jgi:hypothetical protein